MEDGGNVQAVWNFDDAESQLLFKIKVNFVDNLSEWNLESAYWNLRNLKSEVDAKLNRKKYEQYQIEINGKKVLKNMNEKEMLEHLLKQLEDQRNVYLENTDDDEKKGNFYSILEKFYEEICFLMKIHGLYFREGESGEYSYRKR